MTTQTDQEQTDQEWEWETAGPVTLPRLGAWERLEDDDAAMVLAHPAVPSGTFRPNLVLRIGDADGASLATLSTRAVIATLQSLPQAHVVGHEEAVLSGVPARRQKFTYTEAGQAVCVVRWFCIVGTQAIEFTCSFGPEQMTGMESLLYRMASLARIEEAAGIPVTGAPEPAQDAMASEHLGRPLEDLSRIAAVQPYRSTGPIVGDAAYQLLLDSAARGGAGIAGRFRYRDEVAELAAAGLMERGGALTAQARHLLAPLDSGSFSFFVGAQRADLATTIEVRVGAGGALLASGPAPAVSPEARVPKLGQLQIDVVTAAQLPATLVSWLGVGPAWSYIGEHVVLPQEAFADRLRTGSGEAPGEDDSLTRLWAQPWLGWTVQETGTSSPQHTWLSAGSAGQHLVYTNTTGGVELEPFASSAVWSVLARYVHDGLLRTGAR
ncbi:hypothetical protein C4K88_03660 [Arthrobacter pityocampae]|uniref:Uncharacterized protein n=1 Tax=Arthrobacter pityocampae TaxID=547334 RepID=A0A2S5J2D2_9MICC|nr:hypothetical protein [Arthrobacter pityocampae]PPB50964.1 hypothetical protein C4K88_03660 [Arthrobacter pityocampae]